MNVKGSEMTQCYSHVCCYFCYSYNLGSFQEVGEDFKLDHHGRLHGCALLKSTMLQGVPFTTQTLWICTYRTIFLLKIVKSLEKEAPSCFYTKVRCGLLEALPSTH